MPAGGEAMIPIPALEHIHNAERTQMVLKAIGRCALRFAIQRRGQASRLSLGPAKAMKVHITEMRLLHVGQVSIRKDHTHTLTETETRRQLCLPPTDQAQQAPCHKRQTLETRQVGRHRHFWHLPWCRRNRGGNTWCDPAVNPCSQPWPSKSSP